MVSFPAVRLPGGGRRYQCPTCLLTFTKRYNARRHYRTQHLNAESPSSSDEAGAMPDPGAYAADDPQPSGAANVQMESSSDSDDHRVDTEESESEGTSIESDDAEGDSSSSSDDLHDESEAPAQADDYTRATPDAVAIYHLRLSALLDVFSAPHQARLPQARLALQNYAPTEVEAVTSYKHHSKVMRQFVSTEELFICSACKRLLPNRKASCEHCPSRTRVDIAVVLDVGKQMANMFCDAATWQLQANHRQRLTNEPFAFTDILDGSVARDFHRCATGSRTHFTLLINTDGIARFRSVRGSMWPILGTVSELPPTHRRYLEHRVLVGVYYGRDKPPSVFYDEAAKRLNAAKMLGE